MADASATKTCKRFGCGLRYTESANAEDACKHHSSPPSFRDGTKEWPCCKKVGAGAAARAPRAR